MVARLGEEQRQKVVEAERGPGTGSVAPVCRDFVARIGGIFLQFFQRRCIIFNELCRSPHETKTLTGREASWASRRCAVSTSTRKLRRAHQNLLKSRTGVTLYGPPYPCVDLYFGPLPSRTHVCETSSLGFATASSVSEHLSRLQFAGTYRNGFLRLSTVS